MKHIFGFILLLIIISCRPKNENPTIRFYTEEGTFEIAIYPVQAPITSNHFLHCVNQKVFDQKSFYRTVKMNNQPDNEVKIEVIQGGVGFFESDNNEITIPHETTEITGLRHLDGSISMARADTGTASTEFFICIGDQPELDYGGKRNPDGLGFAAFGKVISGMNIVHKIHQQADTNQFYVTPVLIDSIRIID